MMLPLIGRVRGGSFGAGAVATGVALLFGRPILVGLARAGFAVRDGVENLWHEAKAQAEDIHASALQRRGRGRDAATEAEIAALRREIAALKASKRAS